MKLATITMAGMATWMRKHQRVAMVLATFAWGAMILGGLVSLHRYEATPGRVEPSVSDWPASSQIQFTPGIIHVVMFVHPRCPCSRSSLEELHELVNRVHRNVHTTVLFWTPRAADPDWKQTELWRRAATIPGCLVQPDENGVEAIHFGATTSGHTVIFRGDGTRIFSGGLTVQRGKCSHGDIAEILTKIVERNSSYMGLDPEQVEAPVFGCPLFDSCGRNAQGAESCLK